MNGWTKFYTDGAKYIGTDHAIAARIASWQKSKNEDILAVELEYNGQKIKIVGSGSNYWQSDSYESVLPGPNTRLIKRRIMRKIQPSDTFYRVLNSNNLFIVCFNDANSIGSFNKITNRLYNQWLVLEYNVETGTVYNYISENKI